MNNNEKILRYAPDIYEDNKTMLEVYDQEKEEINAHEVLIVQAFFNNFIKTCDYDGIKRFEKIFNILADEINESLEYRKFRVINKFTSQLPYTRIFLERMLEGIFGKEYYELNIINNDYVAKVDIETTIDGLFEETMKDLRQIIPANMTIEQILIQPYTHRYLKKYFTHNELEQFTYGELSKYA